MAMPDETKQHLRSVLVPLHNNNAGVTVAEDHTTVTAVADPDTHASVTPDVRAPSPATDAPDPSDVGGANAAGDKRRYEDDGVGRAYQPPKKREKRDKIQTYEKMLGIDDFTNGVMSKSELAASYKVNEGYIVDIIGNQKAIFGKFYEEVLVMRLYKTGSTDYEIMQKTWTHVGLKQIMTTKRR